MSALSAPVAAAPAFRRRRPAATPPVRLTTGQAVGRTVLMLALLAAGVTLVVREEALRAVEADVFASLLAATFAEEVVVGHNAGHPMVGFLTADDWWFLRITAQCAIAFYLAPIVGLGALLVRVPRVRVWRALVATVAGVALLVALNQVRLLALGYAYSTWGMAGFDWVHGPGGSILMLLGLAATLLTFFMLCLKRPGAQRHKAS